MRARTEPHVALVDPDRLRTYLRDGSDVRAGSRRKPRAVMERIDVPSPPTASPWLTAEEAAERARCGVKTIYREVRAKRLRAARIGGRRELRFLAAWIDEWLMTQITIQ